MSRIALSLSSIHDNKITDKVAVIKNPTKEKIEKAVKKMEPTVISVLTNNFDPIKFQKTQIKAYNKSKQIVYVDIQNVDEIGLDQEPAEMILVSDESKDFLISSTQIEKFVQWYSKKHLGKDFKENSFKQSKKNLTIQGVTKKNIIELEIQTLVLDNFLA
jgi:hypothetical protein